MEEFKQRILRDGIGKADNTHRLLPSIRRRDHRNGLPRGESLR